MDEEDWDLFEKTLKSNKSNKNSDGKISCEGNSHLIPIVAFNIPSS